MNAPTTSRFHSVMSDASRQRSARRTSIWSSSRSIREGLRDMDLTLGRGSDSMQYARGMGLIRVGPARVPSRESPEEAVKLLQARGYSACEIDFEGGFWMEYPWAER